MAQVRARSQLYINSARQAYERAKARALGVPDLPAYPGDGSTVCKSNCACSWRLEPIYDDDDNLIGWNAFWELGAADHCPDCIQRSIQWNPLRL